MKLSYHWLKDLSGIKISPEKMAEILDLHLAETGVKKLSDLNLENIFVGEIIDLKLHPSSDKLKIAILDLGEKYKKLNIVCGAPNIALGQKVPVALPGAKLSTGLEIKKTIIRGTESEGMLCAEDELGLGKDHTGILILECSAKAGEPLEKVFELDDTIFEIENVALTQRPDLFSHQGMAREIRACLNKPRGEDQKFKKREAKPDKMVEVKLEDKNACLRYMAVILDGVKIGPSPLWMQNRLKNLGLRPINNVVDITNYILLEIGQPLHAFDYEKLGGKNIIIRKAKPAEKILALDGKEYGLNENDLVIADATRPIALAGIMGGEESGIDEKTKTIVIESANFEPITIRKTFKRLNLSTESSLRFEKGLPVYFAEAGIERAIELMVKLTGGRLVSKIYDLTTPLAQARLTKKRKILINLRKIKEIVGEEISDKEILEILKSLGFEIKEIDLVKELTKLAKDQIGKPYKYGASTFIEAPNVFDCSSLVLWLYRQIGAELPRLSIEQASYGERVEKEDLKPGDLIFKKRKSDNLIFKKNRKSDFPKDFPQGVGHVGFVLEKNKVIHASGDKKKVVIENLKSFLNKDFVVAERIIKDKIGLVVTVPNFRQDIERQEDLIEEIVRLYGIEKISPRPIIGVSLPASPEKKFLLKKELRNILVGLGFDEVYNYPFSASRGSLELVNPMSPEQRYLRKNLLERLIRNYEKNSPLFDDFKIFEIGKAFSFDQEIKQEDRLAGLIYQKAKPRIISESYTGAKPRSELGSTTGGKEQYWSVKGVIELLFEKIGLDKEEINYQLVLNPSYKQETAVSLGRETIGILGLLEDKVGIFEFDLEKIFNLLAASREKIFKPISAYPPVNRDLAFLIDKSIKWLDIYRRIREIDPLIVKLELFDVFESKKFGDKRNLAFHIIYQSQEETLTSEEVEKIQKRIIEIMEKEFKAQLRTF